MTIPEAAKIRWSKTVIEGLVIVVSILIAFGLDAYWAAQLQRQEEGVLLRALLHEFEVNDSVRIVDRGEHLEVIYAAQGLLNAAGDLQAGRNVSADLDSLLDRFLGVRTHSPSTGAIRALIDGGRLDLIRSDSLCLALAGWPDLMADLYEDESRNWDFADASVRPLVGRYVPLVRFVDPAPAAPMVQTPDYEGLLRSRDFANALVVRLDHCSEIALGIYPPIDEASARIVSHDTA